MGHADTYTTNNGIVKPDGGNHNNWEGPVNITWDLLDESLDGQAEITLAATGSSGSPNTLAITDGISSEGRNRYIKFVDGGDLGATAYVQLTPNDAEKIIFIENGLSGSQAILFFQGTWDAARDLSIAAGTMAVVRFTGGGATSFAYDVLPGISDITGLTPTDGNFIVGDGTNWVAESGNTARTSLSLGTADSPTFADVNATGTFLPTGDTAAGDKSALGYTATEGAILTGQGSTYDISLKNDADALVFGVPTGTMNGYFPGNVGIGVASPDELSHIYGASGSVFSKVETGGTTNSAASLYQNVSTGQTTSSGLFVGYSDAAYIWNYANTATILATNNQARLTLATDGTVTVNNGVLSAPSGISFNNQTLSNYEVGTFTPEIADAASGGNVAIFSTASGWYERQGSEVRVYVQFLNCTTDGLTTGNDCHIRDSGSVLPTPADYTGPVSGSVRHTSGQDSTRMIEQVAGSGGFKIFTNAAFETCVWVSVAAETYLYASWTYKV